MVEEELSVLVVEVVVVVWVVVELVSGVVDWLGEVEGDVAVLGVDCVLLGELDVLCAATQTADSSRIAVIRYSFFILCPPNTFGLHQLRPLRVVGSSAIQLDRQETHGFAPKTSREGKKAELQNMVGESQKSWEQRSEARAAILSSWGLRSP